MLAWYYEMLQLPGVDEAWMESLLLATYMNCNLLLDWTQLERGVLSEVDGKFVRYRTGGNVELPKERSRLEIRCGNFLFELLSAVDRRELGAHRLLALQEHHMFDDVLNVLHGGADEEGKPFNWGFSMPEEWHRSTPWDEIRQFKRAWMRRVRQTYVAAQEPELTEEDEERQELLRQLLMDILQPNQDPAKNLPLEDVGFWFPCPASRFKARLRARAWHATRAWYVRAHSCKDERGKKAMHAYRDALEETYSGAWFASYEHLWDVVDNNNGQLPQRCNSKHGSDAHQKAVCLFVCLSVSLSFCLPVSSKYRSGVNVGWR